MKVLLVEDDLKVARFLARVLVEEGYAADTCASGSDALLQAGTGDRAAYDLIILDWMLPDLDGLSVCRSLRRSGVTTPILMLTARGEVRERVLGLEAGADDYLVKPFEVEELVARVRALLRRSVGFGPLRCGPLSVDRQSRQALLNGAPLSLTGREFMLLLHLLHYADRVIPRSELLERVWLMKYDGGSNMVDVHISRLRDKLGACAWMIETVRGAGYRLRSNEGP